MIGFLKKLPLFPILEGSGSFDFLTLITAFAIFWIVFFFPLRAFFKGS